MDLEDEGWVNIPYDELLEVHDYGDGKILSRKYVKSLAKSLKPICFDTPENSQDFVEDESRFENQVDYEDEVKEVIKLPILINECKETTPESDHDPNHQVFLKKENQFVETKMGSRETNMSRTETGSFQYEEKNGDHVVDCSSPSKMIKQEVVSWENYDQRFNFWKWGLSGIGAFCSLGMTAATIGIIILGNGRRYKQQKIQIYSDKKQRIKNVVQQANEAMSAMRGAPLVKAQITYGGYYESL